MHDDEDTVEIVSKPACDERCCVAHDASMSSIAGQIQAGRSEYDVYRSYLNGLSSSKIPNLLGLIVGYPSAFHRNIVSSPLKEGPLPFISDGKSRLQLLFPHLKACFPSYLPFLARLQFKHITT